MFFDEAKIYVKSGDGGNGLMHFHREKYRPRGGPDGGDGGRGGDVILVATPNVNTLVGFSRKHRFIATDGGKGGPSDRTGASASAVRISVPPGTVVRDEATDSTLADLLEPGQEVIVAKGGRGGRGNGRFAYRTKQTPRVSEKSEPGF